MRAWSMVALGIVPPLFLYLIGRRLWVEIDDERLACRGWRGVNDVNWQDVVSVTPATSLPYPRDRYYGASSYEVRTSDERFIVNLLYFPPEFARAFGGEVKRRRLIRSASPSEPGRPG